MNRNRVAYFGIFLVLFCCTAVPLKSGGYGEYRENRYRSLSSTTDTQRIFEQMIEQRDIKYGNQHTRWVRDLPPTKFKRLFRIDYSAFVVGIGPGNFCSASGKIGEPGEGTVVGPTYYLIIGRARILRWIREVGSN